MQPTNPTWNPGPDAAGDPESENLVLPFQPGHAAHLQDTPTWRLTDDFHSMLIGLALMRSRTPLTGPTLTATQRLLDRLTAIRDEMLVMRSAEGASYGTIGADLDRPKTTATDWVNRARKAHGPDRVWITGRAVDDLPTPPADAAYITRGPIEITSNGITVTYAANAMKQDGTPFPEGSTLKLDGDNFLLRVQAGLILVAVRGTTTPGPDTIELRSTGGVVARIDAAQSEPYDLDQ